MFLGVLSGLVSSLGLFGATTIQSTICDPLLTPTITTPVAHQSVKEGYVYVSGTTSQGATVKISVDGTTKVSVVTDLSGKFGGSVLVAPGKPTIKATASNSCEVKQSGSISVNVSRTSIAPPKGNSTTTIPLPPRTASNKPGAQVSISDNDDIASVGATAVEDLVISFDRSIVDGMQTELSSLYISGKLSPLGTVSIYRDGDLIGETSEVSNLFGLTVPLQSGKNEFIFTAKSGEATVTKALIIWKAESTASGVIDRDTRGRQSVDGWQVGKVAAVISGAVAVVASGSWLLIGAVRRRRRRDKNAGVVESTTL